MLLYSYDRAAHYVNGLRSEKPGQMRVVATDGAVYTAGEVRWLQGRLRDVARACAVGLTDVATSRLNELEVALHSHQPSRTD